MAPPQKAKPRVSKKRKPKYSCQAFFIKSENRGFRWLFLLWVLPSRQPQRGAMPTKKKGPPFKTRSQDEVPTIEQNTKPMQNASSTKLLSTAPLEIQRLSASQVARSALQNASSIASMILTTECARGSRDKRSLFEAAFQVKWSRRLFLFIFVLDVLVCVFALKLDVSFCWRCFVAGGVNVKVKEQLPFDKPPI